MATSLQSQLNVKTTLTFEQAQEFYKRSYQKYEEFRTRKEAPPPEEFDFRTFTLMQFTVLFPEQRRGKSWEYFWEAFCNATFAPGCRCYRKTTMKEWQKDLVEKVAAANW